MACVLLCFRPSVYWLNIDVSVEQWRGNMWKMRRCGILQLICCMFWVCADSAGAVDLKVSGEWETSFSVTDNLYGTANKVILENCGEESGSFSPAQRIRVNFDMVSGEGLSGRLQLQITQSKYMQYYWGYNGVGGSGDIVTARLAYLDWNIPETDVKVRMGRHWMGLPSYTFCSSILSSVVDGIVLFVPVSERVSLNTGWLRPSAAVSKWGEEHVPHSSIDLAFLTVTMTGEGFKATPWGMAGLAGSNTVAAATRENDIIGTVDSSYFGWGGQTAGWEPESKAISVDGRTLLYWLGFSGELSAFDPFKFTADMVYSANDVDGYAAREGWYAALGAEAGMGWGTPFVRAWYASGDDAESKGRRHLMSVRWCGSFDASSIYFDANGFLSPTIDRTDATGTWGVQAGVKNVSFVDRLTHGISVTYFQGTNNTNRLTGDGSNIWKAKPEDIKYMTTSDHAVSFDFINNYELYKNLDVRFLLSYLLNEFDENLRVIEGRKTGFKNAFRGTIDLFYRF